MVVCKSLVLIKQLICRIRKAKRLLFQQILLWMTRWNARNGLILAWSRHVVVLWTQIGVWSFNLLIVICRRKPAIIYRSRWSWDDLILLREIERQREQVLFRVADTHMVSLIICKILMPNWWLDRVLDKVYSPVFCQPGLLLPLLSKKGIWFFGLPRDVMQYHLLFFTTFLIRFYPWFLLLILTDYASLFGLLKVCLALLR